MGALAVVLLPLLMTARADVGETDDSVLLICGFAAKDLVQHVDIARRNGVSQESARATIDYMVPEGVPEDSLNRARRMAAAVIDALYALPVEALERESTKERAVSICRSHWPAIEGEGDKH